MTALRERALALDAWVEIVACKARLRLPRLLAAETFLRRELQVDGPGIVGGQPAEPVLLRAFERALKACPGSTGCLLRSLALRRFLTRHGAPGQLGLGLRREDGSFRGHAWVEADGKIVSGDEGFVRSFRRLEFARPKALADARRTDG